MRRTALVYLLQALVVTVGWLRLERPREGGTALLLALVALAPALVQPLRPRIAAAAAAAVAAVWIAFDRYPLRHPGALLSTFGNGFLDFYDVAVPFDPRVHEPMKSTILVAVFAFCLAVALAVAARRTGAAVMILLLGAGWPATLLAGGNAIGRGGLILLGVLVLLAGLTRRSVPRVTLAAAVALALVAAAASTSPAIAKRELVQWQRWDPYTRPDSPVGVGFVWDSQYDGISFPTKKTVVLKISAPQTSLYWRATVLDGFSDGRWIESGPAERPSSGRPDPLLPRRAGDAEHLVKANVTVEALRDTHLVGGSVPVRFDAGPAPLIHPFSGVAILRDGLTRGLTYTVWSYAPQPTPAQLGRSRPRYPALLTRPGGFLDVGRGATAPAFGLPGRERRVLGLLDRPDLRAYGPLAAAARQVAGDVRSPYAAAVGLESWLRSRGGFTYNEHPPLTSVPPLVGFVAQTRSGYCQYFAGAMALMLRYVGVPARVVAGFTSGSYDPAQHVWTVTDHDAHAWVEVWFAGYGWLPFDPTPGRGRLSAPYSAGSPGFLSGASPALARALGLLDPADIALNGNFREPGGFVRRGTSRADIPGAASPTASGSRGGSLLGLLFLVLLGSGAAIVLTKLAARRTRYLTRDPRRIASACRRELSDFLFDQRIDAARSATLHELGRIVGEELSVDPNAFVAAATAARFGPPEGAPVAARRARQELRRLERRMRQRLSAAERTRGALSLRSLGISA